MTTKADIKLPSITLAGTEMQCYSRLTRIEPIRNTRKDTFCKKGYDWRLTNGYFQGFGPTGFETLVRPLVDTLVQVIFDPGLAASASDANPHLRGDVLVPNFTFVDVEPGDSDEGVTLVQMEFTYVDGTVEKTIDGTNWVAIG